MKFKLRILFQQKKGRKICFNSENSNFEVVCNLNGRKCRNVSTFVMKLMIMVSRLIYFSFVEKSIQRGFLRLSLLLHCIFNALLQFIFFGEFLIYCLSVRYFWVEIFNSEGRNCRFLTNICISGCFTIITAVGKFRAYTLNFYAQT